jgi:RNA polymerase II elongation factor ELL
MRTPGHRRIPSKGFKAGHLAPSSLGSPMLNVPASPMRKPPTSQPSDTHDAILKALRVPLIHLLAVKPSREAHLAETCRTSLANVRDLLPKIAKRSSDDSEKWQLTDKSFREINPYKFTYKNTQDRDLAINAAIKSFDRLRLAKDDKLWQILLPADERGQGKVLSRLNVKAPEQKPSTPLHKMPKLTEKKPAATKKAEEKDSEKEVKKSREVKEPNHEVKPKKTMKEKTLKEKAQPFASVKETTRMTNATPPSTTKSAVPTNRYTPSNDSSKIRTKKIPAPNDSSAPRVKPKMSRELAQKERAPRPSKPAMPVSTKPKNPSPLSASPPVNASDFEDNHPVHKALSAAPSPAKTSSGNSDRSLKRKANDIDSDIHNHSLSVKQARTDSSNSIRTPASSNGRMNGNTPTSISSVKRKSDDSSSSNTPTTKIRKVNNIDTGLASRYPNHNSQISPGDSSSSATSPSVPSLSFRQTVELSQRFQKYYKKYEELYWQLAEADKAPTEQQRNDLMKMHKKLEEMKREIKAGAGVTR